METYLKNAPFMRKQTFHERVLHNLYIGLVPKLEYMFFSFSLSQKKKHIKIIFKV